MSRLGTKFKQIMGKIPVFVRNVRAILKQIIFFIAGERAFLVLAIFVVGFLIWPKPKDFNSQKWMTAFIIIVAAITGALICIAFFYNSISKNLNEQVRKVKLKDDLTAQVVNLQVNFQTLTTIGIVASFLLSFFGFQTYQDIKEAQIEVLKGAITEQKTRIDKLKNDSEKIIRLARFSTDSLSTVIRSITDISFMRIVPVGTIIPYWGEQGKIDTLLWAVCDGKKHGKDQRPTPDLRDRFILGSTLDRAGPLTGGTNEHKHETTLDISGEVDKKSVETSFARKAAVGEPQIGVEIHGHEFKITKKTVTLDANDGLPPYYRLVFLMKIQ